MIFEKMASKFNKDVSLIESLEPICIHLSKDDHPELYAYITSSKKHINKYLNEKKFTQSWEESIRELIHLLLKTAFDNETIEKSQLVRHYFFTASIGLVGLYIQKQLDYTVQQGLNIYNEEELVGAMNTIKEMLFKSLKNVKLIGTNI